MVVTMGLGGSLALPLVLFSWDHLRPTCPPSNTRVVYFQVLCLGPESIEKINTFCAILLYAHNLHSFPNPKFPYFTNPKFHYFTRPNPKFAYYPHLNPYLDPIFWSLTLSSQILLIITLTLRVFSHIFYSLTLTLGFLSLIFLTITLTLSQILLIFRP